MKIPTAVLGSSLTPVQRKYNTPNTRQSTVSTNLALACKLLPAHRARRNDGALAAARAVDGAKRLEAQHDEHEGWRSKLDARTLAQVIEHANLLYEGYREVALVGYAHWAVQLQVRDAEGNVLHQCGSI